MNREIKACKTTVELDTLITAMLTDAGEYENSCGETYLETSQRLKETNTELSEFMSDAETRWFEIECNND